MRHIISVLTEHKPGVLARVSGLFSARSFNIENNLTSIAYNKARKDPWKTRIPHA